MGLAWAAIKPGEAVAAARTIHDPSIRATLVQVTNLGITVKDSPQNTLVLVTRLDDAKPVAGAKVTIRDRDNKVFWTGTTDAHGIAIAPNTDLRRNKEAKTEDEMYEFDWYALGELHFLVTAEKDGDVAYVGSDWNEGIEPWDFDVSYRPRSRPSRCCAARCSPTAASTSSARRCTSRQSCAPTRRTACSCSRRGTKVEVALRDSQGEESTTRTRRRSTRGAAPTGRSRSRPRRRSARTTSSRRRRSIAARSAATSSSPPTAVPTSASTPPSTARAARWPARSSTASSTAAICSARRWPASRVRWTYSKRELDDVPAKVTDRWPSERVTRSSTRTATGTTSTGTADHLRRTRRRSTRRASWRSTSRPTRPRACPYEYTLEGEVTDVTRQQIAGRASFRVDPAPWYLGLQASAVLRRRGERHRHRDRRRRPRRTGRRRA